MLNHTHLKGCWGTCHFCMIFRLTSTSSQTVIGKYPLSSGKRSWPVAGRPIRAEAWPVQSAELPAQGLLLSHPGHGARAVLRVVTSSCTGIPSQPACGAAWSWLIIVCSPIKFWKSQEIRDTRSSQTHFYWPFLDNVYLVLRFYVLSFNLMVEASS